MLDFTKMHGLGNDFVVIDATEHAISLAPDEIRRIADRRLGVGCDQVLLLEPAGDRNHICRYRVFNADGGEAQQCGNGVRCIALYLVEHGRAPQEGFTLAGPAGGVRVESAGNGIFRVDMGVPRLEPGEIPFLAEARDPDYKLTVAGEALTISAVSIGNPHAVLTTDDVDTVDIKRLGPAIENHERFPERANVGFAEVVSRSGIRLRVHERGVGETRACGTGACAAVVSGRLRGLLDERVEVSLPGGKLVIEWSGEGESVWMTGPATSVFEGKIDL